MAQWSKCWDECKDGHTSRKERDSLLKKARFTPPSPAKPSKGKYPHKQKAGLVE